MSIYIIDTDMISSCGFLIIILIGALIYHLFSKKPVTVEGFSNYKSCYGGTARNNANVNASETADQLTGGCNPKTYSPPVNRSYMYTSDIGRSKDVLEGKLNDCMFSGESTPKSFNPPCLTEKPYGNWQASYYYWKYLPDINRKLYRNCDKYRCSTCAQNGETALAYGKESMDKGQNRISPKNTCACSIDPEYFENPEEFCRRNPNKIPCENNWIKDPPQIKDQTAPIPCVKPCKDDRYKPQVPAMKNNYGFNLANTGDVTDGRLILTIRPEFEDILTC